MNPITVTLGILIFLAAIFFFAALFKNAGKGTRRLIGTILSIIVVVALFLLLSGCKTERTYEALHAIEQGKDIHMMGVMNERD